VQGQIIYFLHLFGQDMFFVKIWQHVLIKKKKKKKKLTNEMHTLCNHGSKLCRSDVHDLSLFTLDLHIVY
jgi:hypothetical protein